MCTLGETLSFFSECSVWVSRGSSYSAEIWVGEHGGIRFSATFIWQGERSPMFQGFRTTSNPGDNTPQDPKYVHKMFKNQSNMVSEMVKIEKNGALGRSWGGLGGLLGPNMVKKRPHVISVPLLGLPLGPQWDSQIAQNRFQRRPKIRLGKSLENRSKKGDFLRSRPV